MLSEPELVIAESNLVSLTFLLDNIVSSEEESPVSSEVERAIFIYHVFIILRSDIMLLLKEDPDY